MTLPNENDEYDPEEKPLITPVARLEPFSSSSGSHLSGFHPPESIITTRTERSRVRAGLPTNHALGYNAVALRTVLDSCSIRVLGRHCQLFLPSLSRSQL